MKITNITYEQLVNTGNYENKKVGATAMVDLDDNPEEVYKVLKEFVQTCLKKVR